MFCMHYCLGYSLISGRSSFSLVFGLVLCVEDF